MGVNTFALTVSAQQQELELNHLCHVGRSLSEPLLRMRSYCQMGSVSLKKLPELARPTSLPPTFMVLPVLDSLFPAPAIMVANNLVVLDSHSTFYFGFAAKPSEPHFRLELEPAPLPPAML